MSQLHYRNICDMNQCIVDHLHVLPRDLDLIVGVPRSGMLAANMLALHLDLPLTDVQGLLDGRVLQGGDRQRFVPDNKPRTVLIVDDAAYTGTQVARVREQLQGASLAGTTLFACIYALPARLDDFDFVFETLPGQRWLFEWNKLNHGMVASMCVDLDGVLCRDPLPAEDDDGDAYRTFIRTAQPKFRPRRRIGWIVTSRLERYRSETETWLAEHGVDYGKLVMMDAPSRSSRTSWRCAQFKARVYRETPSSLFVESSLGQAQHICHLAGRPVLCTQNAQMLHPGRSDVVAARSRHWRNWLTRQLRPSRLNGHSATGT